MKRSKLELTWIGKEQQPRLEPRILIEDPSKSYIAPRRVTPSDQFDNRLIYGDNLLALKALEQEFAGQVKCIYIDPPYNTGSMLEHYDDGLEHSLWLSMMHQRLEVLKVLLAPDGVICVQIGDDEMAYLKVLMDEVFGRRNLLGQIAIRMSHSAGMKRKSADRRIIKNSEFLLVYGNTGTPTVNPQYEECLDYPVNYYHYITRMPNGKRPGKYVPLIDIVVERFSAKITHFGLQKNNKSIGLLYSFDGEFRDFIINEASRICRKDTNVPKLDADTNLAADEFVAVQSDSRQYFMGHSSSGSLWQLYTLQEKIRNLITSEIDGEVVSRRALVNLLGDWWDGFWRDMSRVDIEGGVKMKASKKPERLIARVLSMFTTEGDLVLDSFLGSGTTAAVAHKMRRRWIGIELGEHCHTLALPRLKSVVDGTDNTGITRAERWRGGGGFRYFRLAPSLMQKDRWGNWVINKDYNPAMLAEALCKLEGFAYAPSETVYWQHGQSSERDYIYVTTANLSHDQLRQLSDDVGADRSLLVLCTAFRGGGDFPNLTIKKIPRQVLSRCEWGRDDYSLKVESLPQIPPQPGQSTLGLDSLEE